MQLGLNSLDKYRKGLECLGTVDVIVTVVHGTWGGNGEFGRDDSLFNRNLRERLGNSRFLLRLFPWSGNNRDADRRIAASDLRLFVSAGIIDQPNATQILICHSHGGTVALYAMEDQSFADSISGIVTLATPFIKVNKQPLPTRLSDFVDETISNRGKYTILSLFFFLFFFPFFLIFLVSLISDPKDALSLIKEPETGLLFLSPPFVIGIIWATVIQRKVMPKQEIDTFELPVDSRYKNPNWMHKALLVRAAADEAAGAIGFLAFLGWLSSRCWGGIALLRHLVPEWTRKSITAGILKSYSVVCVLGWTAIIVMGLRDPAFGETHRVVLDTAARIGIAALISLMCINLPRIITQLALIPLAVICWSAARASGFNVSLADAVRIRFSAEVSPSEGPWSFSLAKMSDQSIVSGWKLMHSNPFTEVSNINMIVNWIEQRCNERL